MVASASEHYQQTLDRKVFYDLQNVRNISDVVIIWGKSQREHDFYLQKALQQIREHGLTLNKETCLFNRTKVTFFGMVLLIDGISADETKIQAIKKLNLLCSIVPMWEHIFITPILFNIDLTFAILLIALIKEGWQTM